MADPICQIHMRPEPDLPGDFRPCGECYHVFRTREELEDAAYANELGMLEYWPLHKPHRWPAEEIYACPLCTHDF